MRCDKFCIDVILANALNAVRTQLLEFVRVLVSILIQSGKYKKATKVIEEHPFSEKGSCAIPLNLFVID
jgi:hypothetical protein